MMRMSAPASTASKVAVNLVSRSRIKKRNPFGVVAEVCEQVGPCWVTQAPVGWAVIAARCPRRVSCSITTRM